MAVVTAGEVNQLLNATVAGLGAAFEATAAVDERTFQATGSTSSGTGAASVAILVSNDGVGWITLATISLSLSSTPATDGFASDARWKFTKAQLVSISGTGAAVTVTMGN